MARLIEYDNDIFLAAIEQYEGVCINFSEVSKAVGCSFMTAKNRILSSKELKEAFDAKLDQSLDDIETTAFELAGAGSERMIAFILSTKGKDRGYGTQPTAIINNNNVNAAQFNNGGDMSENVIHYFIGKGLDGQIFITKTQDIGDSKFRFFRGSKIENGVNCILVSEGREITDHEIRLLNDRLGLGFDVFDFVKGDILQIGANYTDCNETTM